MHLIHTHFEQVFVLSTFPCKFDEVAVHLTCKQMAALGVCVPVVDAAVNLQSLLMLRETSVCKLLQLLVLVRHANLSGEVCKFRRGLWEVENGHAVWLFVFSTRCRCFNTHTVESSSAMAIHYSFDIF